MTVDKTLVFGVTRTAFMYSAQKQNHCYMMEHVRLIEGKRFFTGDLKGFGVTGCVMCRPTLQGLV